MASLLIYGTNFNVKGWIINMKNKNLKIIFLTCDNFVSHLLSKISQVTSNTPTSIIESIHINSSSVITNNISYRCMNSDIGKYASRNEGIKYSVLFPHLTIKYSVDDISESFTEKELLEKYGIMMPRSYYHSGNIMLITSSDTPRETLNSIKKIMHNNSTNLYNYLHIHCEPGNHIDGGAIYTSQRGTYLSSLKENFTEIKQFECGDPNSLETTAQVLMASNVAFTIFNNLIFFNIFQEDYTYFNFSKLQLDSTEYIEELPKPIKLLSSKKSYKKKGSKKKSYKSDNRYNILIVGLGATGSMMLSDLIHLANVNHTDIRQIALLDGDHVEAKNLLNQRLLRSEINEPKVNALKNRYSQVYQNVKITSHPQYLYELNNELIKSIFNLKSTKDTNLCIITCVDNNETRKEVDRYFYKENSFRNLIHIDSGNGAEKREGQTVIGYKQYHKVLLDSVAGSGIDFGTIRENTNDIKVIGSCTQRIKEAPQHIATNVFAATSLLIHLYTIFIYKEIRAHHSFFDLEELYLNTR